MGGRTTGALSIRIRVVMFAGVALVLAGIVLPWWTFQLSVFGGGPTELYGWQFSIFAALLLTSLLVITIAEVLRRPARARLFYSVLLLILASVSLVLSWVYLDDFWFANCTVECFGPNHPAPGVGLPVVLIGAILVLAAQAPPRAKAASEAAEHS